ncbi:MAG: flagellar biosynthesis repressor FlbT [Pseudomonadota bacterium]
MPLIIDLKPGEKVIINGSVIENAGSSTKLRIHNQSNILKQKEIMTEAEATTPASRVYFCLQCAYIFPEERDKYVELFTNYLRQYVEACPSAAPIVDEMVEEVAGENYYKGIRLARKLLKHEGKLFAHMRGEDVDDD